MIYEPPSLLTDIILIEQSTAPILPLNVVLCEPVAADVLLTVDGVISVSGGLFLTSIFDIPGGYQPPSLSVEVVLPVQTELPTLPLNVILCAPSGADEVTSITIDSGIEVKSELSLVVDVNATNISIDTVCDINPRSEIKANYDANVFRGLMLDTQTGIQQAKLQCITNKSIFDGATFDRADTKVEIDTSLPLGFDNQFYFEANKKLTSSSRFLFDSEKFVSTSSYHMGEYQKILTSKSKFAFEGAKKVSLSCYYGFEVMAKRQNERNIQVGYSYISAVMKRTESEYGKLSGHRTSLLIEKARLPFSKTGYLLPSLRQTVILRKQLVAPEPPLDIVMCTPKVFGKHVKLTVGSQAILNAIAVLRLTAIERAYNAGVIFVTNSVSLTRSDDGREIKLLGFSVGIDSNSCYWSFSATVPLSELPKVNTAYEQQIGVDFEFNGEYARFILDSCDDSASFGESSLTIKGKSRAMLLASPYSSQRGFKYDTAMSARQIAEDELNRGGVPSGFTLDWQLAGVNGWNVPAKTYSYSNKTPINSLQWIAEAAGGFINAHMSEDIIHVLANYPIPSWEWSDQTPLLTLPMSLITSRSRGRVNKPTYNGVTLYGENDNGIGALIKRTGTSGGYQPPMVTSDLMTDQEAAISRGKMILSDTGDIGNIGISMPLHSDFGVLKPSTLIGVNDGESWIGMVRGTTITGRLSSNRALEIDQSIDVERHFDKEATSG